MTDSGTVAWLAVMNGLNGTKWAPGDAKNPKIEGWLDAIGQAYPGMKPYCDAEEPLDYFSWCGLTVGYCMAKAGIAPVFGTSDTGRFLWAAAWMGWGTPVSAPQAGDVVIFDFGNNDHHVSLFVKDNGDGTWSCLGGNQGHQVTTSNFHKSSVMGVRRPIISTVPAVEAPSVVPAASPGGQDFNACVLLVLHDEGGNDDDPDDPGGRTSRGITQTDWNEWLKTHPSLPADVFQAPQDQIVAIYHDDYWIKLSCDGLPAGVDYVVFDYGVLSGIGQSSKVLQGYVGAAVDGEIGPQTIAATAQADVATLINQISDERITYMQQSPVWPKYGKGWTARVQRARAAALAMASAAASQPKPAAPQQPQIAVQPPAGQQQMNPDQIAQLLLTIFNGLQAQQPAGTQPPALNQATLQPILAAVAKLLAAQGGTPAAAAAAPPPPPPPPPQAPTASSPSAVSNPSVQIGALGLAITSFLQAIGTIAPPFGSVFHTASTTTPTTISTDPMVGTLATVIPLIVAGLGATGGWGSLLGIASSLIGAIGNAAKKSP
ncbi:MAG TPA: glycosyl hydrolase 108 family protein [Bradyrhizobium sp.]|nr:glycosyl hydrolase 108 family protein [Bradyrhizobium sp.]